MGIYRKKPIDIEIRIWDGTPEGATPIIDWILDNGHTARFIGEDEGGPGLSAAEIRIDTLEGVMLASPGAGIAKGVKGEFYPIRADILAETYEKVSD